MKSGDQILWAVGVLVSGALFVGCGCSQRVHGVIRDWQEREPLVGAVVQVGNRKAVTGAQGAFQLRTSCARDQVLTVTAAGFRAETYTLKLRLKERRNNMKRDFYLKSNRPAAPAPAPAPAARPFNPRPAPDEWTICPTCRKPKHMKPVAAPAPPSVACPGCGKQIDQDSKFCKECGTPQ